VTVGVAATHNRNTTTVPSSVVVVVARRRTFRARRSLINYRRRPDRSVAVAARQQPVRRVPRRGTRDGGARRDCNPSFRIPTVTRALLFGAINLCVCGRRLSAAPSRLPVSRRLVIINNNRSNCSRRASLAGYRAKTFTYFLSYCIRHAHAHSGPMRK